MNFKEQFRKYSIESIFLLVLLVAVGYLKGINTVVFLTLFLLLFALTSYSLIGLYNLIRGLKENWLLGQFLGAAALSVIVYFKYGSFPLLKTLAFSFVIVVVIVVYTKVVVKRR